MSCAPGQGQRQSQDAARVERIDDAIIPEPRGRVVRMPLTLELLADRRFQLLFLGGAQGAPAALQCLALDGRQHAGGLLAAHDRGARVRPLKQEARAVGAAAHRVIAGAEAAADDHGVLRHRRAGHGRHQLGAVLGNAARLRGLAHHEAGDVLQKHQRYAFAAAQFDEMRALQCALGKQDAVVGQNSHRRAVDVGKAADQGGAVQRLEFIEPRAIDQARDELAHVVGLARARRNDAVQFRRIVRRFAALAAGARRTAAADGAHGGAGRSRATARRANASACVSFSA